MKTVLYAFCLMVVFYFMVVGIEIYRSADVYDDERVRSFYRVRGVSTVLQGAVRCLLLLAASVVYANLGFRDQTAFNAAVTVMVTVAAANGVETLVNMLLVWNGLSRDTGLTRRDLLLATNSDMALHRLVVYPAYMAAVAFVLVAFPSPWVAVGVAVLMALANGMLYSMAIMEAIRSMGGEYEPASQQIQEDSKNLLDFDPAKIRVEKNTDVINAYADVHGGVTLYDTLVRALTHRAVMGVVGHEVGHVRLVHVSINLGAALILSMVAVVASTVALRFGGPAARMLGLPTEPTAAVVAGFVVFMTVEPMMRVVTQAILSKISVSHEYQADAYSARKLGPGPMAEALRSFGDTAALTYSTPLLHSFPTHPPTGKRLLAIAKLEGKYPDRL